MNKRMESERISEEEREVVVAMITLLWLLLFAEEDGFWGPG